MSQDLLAAVFGWMTVLNIALLLFTTVMILTLQDWIAGVHSRLFGMDPAQVKTAYFRYLAQYKLMTLVFCLIPWLALKLA